MIIKPQLSFCIKIHLSCWLDIVKQGLQNRRTPIPDDWGCQIYSLSPERLSDAQYGHLFAKRKCCMKNRAWNAMQHSLHTLAVLKAGKHTQFNTLIPDQWAFWNTERHKVELLNRESKSKLSKVLSLTCLALFSRFVIASAGGISFDHFSSTHCRKPSYIVEMPLWV